VPLSGKKWRLQRNGRFRILVAGLLLFLITSAGWIAHATTQQVSPVKVAAATQSTANGPIIPPASRGDQCVADTALMRTDHMDLLNHQRDETVIQGIRNNPFSLVGCVNCHARTTAEGTPIRIDAEGQFCQSCHAYAAVKIDCFTCHAALPEPVQEQEQSAAWLPELNNESGQNINVGNDQPHSMIAKYSADLSQLISESFNDINSLKDGDQTDHSVHRK